MTRRRTIPPGIVSLLIVGGAFAALLVYVVIETDSDWALFFQLTEGTNRNETVAGGAPAERDAVAGQEGANL